MSRQHRSMTEEAAEALESHREADESFSQFALRIAAILDDSDNGTDVTEPLRSDDLLTYEQFHEYMQDFSSDLPEKTADLIDDRFG